MGQDLDWLHNFGDTGFDHSTELIVDDDNNNYIVGNFNGSIDFDLGEEEFIVSSEPVTSSCIAKYEQDGGFGWLVQFQGLSYYSGVHNVEIDSEGNLVALGEYRG